MRSVSVEVAAEVLDQVREWLARHPGEITPHRVAEAVRATGRPMGDATVLAVHETIRRDAVGAGVLDPLLQLPGVTDVLVNGPDQVFVDVGRGLEPSPTRFTDEAAVRRLAQRLAAAGGRRLDDAQPYVDLRLPDGTRFHAVLAPIAHPGTLISLRVPRPVGFTLAGLGTQGCFTEEVAQILIGLVGARVPYLISGGTGAGKTTLLSAMVAQVPDTERIVVVEDAAELRPAHPHVVSLEARPANVEGAGRIALTTLVRQALRMRPDRLVVGEVRGAEITDLLAALNTGHEGGCGTIHANSAADVPARAEALALSAGMDRAALHSQLAAGVGAVVHVVRDRGGRRVSQISVPVRTPDGLVSMQPAVTCTDRVEHGPGWHQLRGLLW